MTNQVEFVDFGWALQNVAIAAGTVLAPVVAAAIGVFIAFAIARRALTWFDVGISGEGEASSGVDVRKIDVGDYVHANTFEADMTRITESITEEDWGEALRRD